MPIGSQVFTAEHNSSGSQKRSIPFGEFLLSLFVVVAATLLGAAGGIWLAERNRSTGRQEEAASAPQASLRLSSPPLSMVSEHPKADLPAVQVPKAAGKKSDSEVISLGLPSVRAIHHSYRTDYTEIAIELRAAVLLRAAQLHNPERVYFDLAHSGRAQRPKGRLKSHREVAINDDRVAGVRVARWESEAVRVVVDLKRPCKYSYRLSAAPPSLLILELRTHPPGSLARQKPGRQGVAGSSEELAANRR